MYNTFSIIKHHYSTQGMIQLTYTTKINFTRLRKKRALVQQLSQKRDPHGCVHFSTSASCHEVHNIVYSETKLNSKGELQCHAAIWRQWRLMG